MSYAVQEKKIEAPKPPVYHCGLCGDEVRKGQLICYECRQHGIQIQTEKF